MSDAFQPKSDFLRVMQERGYVHQCSDLRGPRRQGALGRPRRLYRLRLHGAVAACRLAGADHDAALAAGDRRQAGGADGRRHDHGRRSVRQGREPQAAHRRGDRGQQGRHQTGLRPFHPLRRRQARRHHAGQRRVAGEAQLHRFPARGRPAFLGQPHAGDGFGEAAGSSASTSSPSSNSTTCACRPTTSPSSTGATA